MTEAPFENFCIVGYGRHAQNKLVPAIAAAGKSCVGIVSGKDPSSLPQLIPHFPSLDLAIERLDKDVCFVVTSPPSMHFSQSKRILKSGRNVFVEKPVCCAMSELEELIEISIGQQVIFVQMLMHKFSRMHQIFLENLRNTPASVSSVLTRFLIPAMPPSTFRDRPQKGDDILFDFACYPFSLMYDARVKINEMNLLSLEKTYCAFEVDGVCDEQPVNIRAELGLGSAYVNLVEVRHSQSSLACYSPFFFGRPGVRNIVRTEMQIETHEELYEQDCFVKLFKEPRSKWVSKQADHFQEMRFIVWALEALNKRAISG